MVMSNPLNSKVMGNSKWAQTKSGLLSEIESLKAEVNDLKIQLGKSANECDMYRRWWAEAKADAGRHEAVMEVMRDHMNTLKSMYAPSLIAQSEEV